jgi:hypothetical protein
MTNNKQQTPLEWFIEELEEKGKAYEENQVVRTINICIDVSDYMELKVQAQEMERQRMIEFTNEWFEEYQCGLDNFKNPEKYYNETYGGGEQ